MLQLMGWSLLASVAAVSMETYARATYHWALWFVPLALIINVAVYKSVVAAPTFLMTFVFFSLFNVVMRVGISHFYLKEAISGTNAVAAGALLVAALAKVVWR